MLQTIIELADGTCIGAGAPGTAVMSARLTQSVNAGTELTLGSVCAAMAEITLRVPDGCPIAAGDSFTLYKRSASGQLHRLGVFTAEQPQWQSGKKVKITAYDAVTKLDRDITGWLATLDGWPYTLQELAQLVCAECGVALEEVDLPNGTFPVARFTADGLTGRDLMSWIGQAAGRFCIADEYGTVCFRWYTDAPLSIGVQEQFGIAVTETEGHLTLEGLAATGALELSGNIGSTDDGDGNVTVWGCDRLWYRQGSLRAQDYETAPITGVQLRADDGDTGTVYGGGENVYIVEGNPLLTGSAEALTAVAEKLYGVLADFSHTPMTVTVTDDLRLRPGQLVNVTDSRGKTARLCIMSREMAAGTTRLTGSGSQNLHSTTAVNNRSFKALSGKILRLRTDVEGIRAAHEDLRGQTASLILTADGITAQVKKQEQVLEELKTSAAQLAVDAGSIRAVVETIRENGVDRVQNEFGLTVDGSAVTIQRSDSEMTNRLDERGMSVVRGQGGNQTTMLRADADGVVATDVSVRNYLCIGSHARLEDYTDGTDSKRTACYWREDT